MITLKVALRNVFRHRSRSIITLSAIAFGCAALIFVGSFFEDVFFKMRESYIQAHTGHIQIYTKGFFEKGRLEPYSYIIKNPNEIISMVKGIKGIKFVTKRLEFSGLISTGENSISFIGQGFEPKHERMIINYAGSDVKQMTKDLSMSAGIVVSGEPLTENENDGYSVVLGKGLASSLGAKTGDSLVLLANTVNGSINALDITVKGLFSTSSKIFDDHMLRMPLLTAQKLLRTDSALSLVIMLNKTEDTLRVKKDLERLFAEKNLDLELKTWDELTDFYTKTVELFNRFFFIIKAVITIIVILSIYNTMNMAVLERISEIGTIMAMGTKRSGVLGLFLCEGMALGTIGGIIGIFSGIIITTLVARTGIPMPPPPGASLPWLSEPKITFSTLLLAFFLAIVTALISSLYPAYKASRLEIADALRYR